MYSFAQVRNFEAFKFLHLGILSEIKRKSLPAIARAVGLEDSQQLHHFLRDSSWDVAAVRQTRFKYKTKPELAVEIIQELKALGFKIKLILADSLYGESGDVIGVLTKLKLKLLKVPSP